MFSITLLLYDAPFPGDPTNIRILSESRFVGLHRRHLQYSLCSFRFSWWAPKDARVLKHGA